MPWDHAFDGAVRVRALTAGGERDRPLPDIEGVHLAEGSETPQGQAVTLTLPAQSFTVVEAATTGR